MDNLNVDFLARHLTLRQLQLFETVARMGSYTRAAEVLHLTQPTVSMQIKKLADTIGLPLLEQVGRHIHMTTAGREVYASARNILAHLAALEDTISELKGVVKGELRVAVVTTAKYFMPHLLGAFLHTYPEVEPRLKVTNRARVIERLTANQDDLIIMGQVPEELDVQAHPFLENVLVVVAAPGHPFAREQGISLERLARDRFLVREPGSGTRMAVDRFFAERNLKIEPYMELGSSEAIKQGVMAGLGLSVLSLYNLRLELTGGHIAVLDVEGFPLKRRWYAVHLKGKKLSLVARTFLDFLLNKGADALLHAAGDEANTPTETRAAPGVEGVTFIP